MSYTKHPQEVPKKEEGILNFLLDTRNELSQLKQNRKQYLKSADVQIIYQNVLTKVRQLDDIRKNDHLSPSISAATLIHNTELHNRVDSVLDDVFQLLSLCFLTVGLKNSAPATYASLSTVQSLLEHLEESSIYTLHDLKPIKERLDVISKIVEKSCSSNVNNHDFGADSDNAEIREIDNERTKNKMEQDLLLKAKLNHCLDEYHKLESRLEDIDPNLNIILENLYQIRRGLLSLIASLKDNSNSNPDLLNEDISELALDDNNNKKPQHRNERFVKERYELLKKQLRDIENQRDEDGQFITAHSTKGSTVVNGLLDNCNDLVNDLSHQAENGNELKLSLDPYLQPIYEQLIDIKTTLANLMITRRWTLRETDLFSYQKALNDIDSKRVGGKFPTKSPDSKGQAILLYLLRRCYAIIYKLLESSEPVSESLQPIHNQLSTVRRCLLELKRMGGVENERELYPYQMKLASLDNLRQNGNFVDSDGNIPEGQGILNALLAGCFDIVHELKIEAESREEEDQEEDSEEDDEREETTEDDE